MIFRCDWKQILNHVLAQIQVEIPSLSDIDVHLLSHRSPDPPVDFWVLGLVEVDAGAVRILGEGEILAVISRGVPSGAVG